MSKNHDYALRTIVCKGCGKTVTGHLSPHREYCSVECLRTSPKPWRKNGKTIACEICGKEFYVPLSRLKQNARFCSTTCANAWQSRNKTEHICKICGKTFYWSPSRSKSANHNITYCSLRCRDKDPERRKMLLEMIAKQQQLKPNKLERLGYAMLDSLGISYSPQHVIANKFCVDAFVPSSNLVIQFDGDYWHGHPDKYTELDSRQERRVRLDQSQDAYMNKCGYTVLRFWGSDIRNHPDQVKQALASAIQT